MSVLWYLNCAYDACARMVGNVRDMITPKPRKEYGLCEDCYGSGRASTELVCDRCDGYGTVVLSK